MIELGAIMPVSKESVVVHFRWPKLMFELKLVTISDHFLRRQAYRRQKIGKKCKYPYNSNEVSSDLLLILLEQYETCHDITKTRKDRTKAD